MITYLQFIEELKELKEKPHWDHHWDHPAIAQYWDHPAIDEMIAKYEAIVAEHEQQENA